MWASQTHSESNDKLLSIPIAKNTTNSQQKLVLIATFCRGYATNFQVLVERGGHCSLYKIRVVLQLVERARQWSLYKGSTSSICRRTRRSGCFEKVVLIVQVLL